MRPRFKFCLERVSLECPKQPSPAHQTWVHECIRIGKKAFANLARLPGVLWNVERHVDHDGCTDYVVSRDRSPETAVVGIAAVVAHYEVAVRFNFERKFLVVGIGAANRVRLLQ